MKCVKNVLTQEVKKVKDLQAAKLVGSQEYMYCPKKEWKVIRDKNKPQKTEPEKKAKQTKSKPKSKNYSRYRSKKS